MAQYKAIESFGGVVSMSVGEVRDIDNEEVAKDLLRAGYIELLAPIEEKKPKTTTKRTTKKTTTKK